MNAAFLLVGGIVFYFLGYRFYSRWLAHKVFRLGGEHEEESARPPAHELYDGIDFTPAKKSILFGHHYSSIAGAAPIVGPAVAVIWGWLPAFLWVVLGPIFMGACHDFGALVLSMRSKGESLGQMGNRVFGPQVKWPFLGIVFFLIWMVIAVFALVIAGLFITYPSSVLPVNFEIIIAVAIGLYTKKGDKSLALPSLLAQALLMLMIYLGTLYPLSFSENPRVSWILILMAYSFIASCLPVWTLLRPRDYINSHQLIIGLVLLVVGVVVTAPPMKAPALNLSPAGAPPWFPYLFITIACGAISGFHGLVSAGTTSKQVDKWEDARPIGYGAMLGEGLLALLATLAVSAGLASEHAWHHHYSSWGAASGLNAKISAFVQGSSFFLEGIGLPAQVGQTIMAVMIISFAATSLDTATRIQRYIIGEVGDGLKLNFLKNRFIGSGIAIGSAMLLIFMKEGGKGGLTLWPLFGATNQLLAGLSLAIIAFYLKERNRNYWPYFIPMIFVSIITGMALVISLQNYYGQQNWFLFTLGVVLLFCQVGILLTAFRAFYSKGRGKI